MKKIIALVLALFCLTVLVSCGNKAENKADTEVVQKTAEEEATEVIKGFMDALISFDYDAMGSFVADPALLPEELRQFDKTEGVESAIPDELKSHTDKFEKYLDNVLGRFTKAMSYEIKETKGKDDSFTFTVQLTTPDFANIDLETYMAEKLNEDAINSIVEDLISSGGLTETTTEEEAMDILVSKMFEFMNKAVEEMSFELVSADKEFVVKKTDGKWLVDFFEQ